MVDLLALQRHPRARPHRMDGRSSFWHPTGMGEPWQLRPAVRRLTEGCTLLEASRAVRVSGAAPPASPPPPRRRRVPRSRAVLPAVGRGCRTGRSFAASRRTRKSGMRAPSRPTTSARRPSSRASRTSAGGVRARRSARVAGRSVGLAMPALSQVGCVIARLGKSRPTRRAHPRGRVSGGRRGSIGRG
jgi:hypothetical protein